MSYEIKDYSRDEQLKMIEEDPNNLRYIGNQTEELCLAAVRRNGEALQFVKNKTEEICFEAIDNSGCSYYLPPIIYIENPTEEMELRTILAYCWDLKYVKNQTGKLYLTFVDTYLGQVDNKFLDLIRYPLKFVHYLKEESLLKEHLLKEDKEYVEWLTAAYKEYEQLKEELKEAI